MRRLHFSWDFCHGFFMIAPNACGGKGFARVENAAAAQSLRSALQLGHHAFVKHFIMLPEFGPGGVNVA
jgi:hypothetical protein